VLTRPRQELLKEIHALKREMLLVRRSVWPVKEVIASLRHVDSRLIARATSPYLRDLQDHIEQVLEGVETHQNLLSDMLAAYLSTLSNRTNTVMRVLAVFSAVFMPLTFVTGIFGMNFRHMPVLELEWGFAVTLAAMITIGGLMVAFFLRRRWL
jgi:magnesium transporter